MCSDYTAIPTRRQSLKIANQKILVAPTGPLILAVLGYENDAGTTFITIPAKSANLSRFSDVDKSAFMSASILVDCNA